MENSIVEISGVLYSGLGRGRYFMSQKIYLNQIFEKLSIVPYPGTLNLRVLEKDLDKLKEVKKDEKILITGFVSEGKTFGDVIAYRAELNGTRCGVVIPKLSKHVNTIEVIAEKYLRGEFGLVDGDIVTVRISLD